MPHHFLDIHVACLKRTMLARAAHGFMFTPQDVQEVMQETDLNQAQIQAWADNFRFRHAGEKERLEYLGPDKQVHDHPSFFGVGKVLNPKLEGSNVTTSHPWESLS